MEELTAQQKSEYRRMALDYASKTHFDSAESLLSIACKIYEWLIKK